MKRPNQRPQPVCSQRPCWSWDCVRGIRGEWHHQSKRQIYWYLSNSHEDSLSLFAGYGFLNCRKPLKIGFSNQKVCWHLWSIYDKGKTIKKLLSVCKSPSENLKCKPGNLNQSFNLVCWIEIYNQVLGCAISNLWNWPSEEMCNLGWICIYQKWEWQL